MNVEPAATMTLHRNPFHPDVGHDDLAPPPIQQELGKICQKNSNDVCVETHASSSSKTDDIEEISLSRGPSNSTDPVNFGVRSEISAEGSREDNGRERLKRHRIEVAGRVWIPDIWGQEQLLKDWIDCSAFDASLVPSEIVSARAALVREGRIRANSGGFRIENRC